jgi:GntR family transcriptional regulator/MocR family aminotransferase
MIFIDENSKTPIYQQIYEQLKAAIEKAELRAGEKLPATRTLAGTLCVGRNTVENAYQQLLVEGYVDSKIGSGYQVMDISEGLFYREHKTSKPIRQHYESIQPPPAEDSGNYPPVRYDFHYKNMDSAFFPHTLWRKYSNQLLSIENNKQITSYCDKQGEYSLRREIGKYLYKLRGLTCDADQIVVCCGLQFALEKICHLLPEEYHHVGMEEPGYDSARLVFEKQGFSMTPIPVYPKPNYNRAIENPSIKTLFVTPSHQFPAGHTMPVAARMTILKWARAKDCYIIEDDYDSEYRYNSKPIPPLRSIDTDERVIYLGTFSKVLSPSLRISYLILPPHMVSIYHKVYQGLHPTASWLQQSTLALYMRDGQMEKHIRRTFKAYKERHDCLIKALEDHLGDRAAVLGHNAGLHVLLKVKRAGDQNDLIRKAREVGVKIYPTKPYWMQQGSCPPDVVMLGYGQISKEDIVEGLKLLKKAWFSPK